MLTVHQVFNGLLLIAFCVLATFGVTRLAGAFADWLVARQGRTFQRPVAALADQDEPPRHPALSYVEPGEVDVLPDFVPAPPADGECRGADLVEQRLVDALCADGNVAVYKDALYRRVGDDWARVALASIVAAHKKCWDVYGASPHIGKPWPSLKDLRAPFLPSLLVVSNAVLIVDAHAVTIRAYPINWLYRADFYDTQKTSTIDWADVGKDGIYRPALRRDDPHDYVLGHVRFLLFGLILPGMLMDAGWHDALYDRFRDAAHAEFIRREAAALRQAADGVQPEPVADQPASASTRKRL